MKIVDKLFKTLRIFGRPDADIGESVKHSELIGEEKLSEYCPHCNSRKFVKKGNRKKKLEIVQLYKCNACHKVFTSQLIKGNRFPSNVIIDGLSYYNLGFGLEDTCRSKLT